MLWIRKCLEYYLEGALKMTNMKMTDMKLTDMKLQDMFQVSE